MKKGKLGDVLKFCIFLGIGIFFIYWFLIKLEPAQKQAIWQSFLEADYLWVGLVMLCCLCSHLVRALRWQLLYTPLGCKPGLNNTFGSVVIAYMANLAFPRLGEVMRCATLRTSDGIPIEKSLGTVVTERIIDVLAFGVVVVMGMLVMYGQAKDWLYDALSEKFQSLPSVGMILAVGFGLLAILFLCYKLFWKRLLRFKFFQKINDLFVGCLDGIRSILHLGGRNTLLFILYSVLIYFLYIMGGLLIFQAFDETAGLGMGAAFVLYLFGSVGMGLSQGGIGVYPVLVQMALSLYGVGMEVGTAAGWLLWGAQQVIIILVGLGYLIKFSIIKHNDKR